MVQLLWKTLWKLFKKIKNRNRITIWSSNPTSGYIPQRTESKILNRYLYIHVRSTITHNSHEVEATQMFTDGWIDE